VIALVGLVIALNLLQAKPFSGIPVIGYALETRFALPFSLGMLAWVLRDRIPLDDRIAALAVVVCAVTLRVGGFSPIGVVAYAYLILWAAWRIPVYGFARKTDVSYGLYIYAFPVQQTVAAFLPGIGPLAFMIASFAGTLPLAWLSYRLIEAPALKVKDVTIALPRRSRAGDPVPVAEAADTGPHRG
jgi:peptidoglycan/LPS O-acetylase OafA/YrhL